MGYSPWGFKESDTTEQQHTAQQFYIYTYPYINEYLYLAKKSVFKYYDYPQRTDFPALRMFKIKSIVSNFQEKSQNIWGR